jgi:hypothetical protein
MTLASELAIVSELEIVLELVIEVIEVTETVSVLPMPRLVRHTTNYNSEEDIECMIRGDFDVEEYYKRIKRENFEVNEHICRQNFDLDETIYINMNG